MGTVNKTVSWFGERTLCQAVPVRRVPEEGAPQEASERTSHVIACVKWGHAPATAHRPPTTHRAHLQMTRLAQRWEGPQLAILTICLCVAASSRTGKAWVAARLGLVMVVETSGARWGSSATDASRSIHLASEPI